MADFISVPDNPTPDELGKSINSLHACLHLIVDASKEDVLEEVLGPLGIPTIYIEVFDRMDTATLTAKLCRPFTTRMLVQWDEQQALYPEAIVVGPLL